MNTGKTQISMSDATITKNVKFIILLMITLYYKIGQLGTHVG